MRNNSHYIGAKYKVVRDEYNGRAYTDQMGNFQPGYIVHDFREVTVKAVGFWNNGYEEDTPLLIAESTDGLVFNGYVNTIDYWGGIHWQEKVVKETGWKTWNERATYVNPDGTKFEWPPSKAHLRDAVRSAIDAALAGNQLSEDWAASLYANLDEPPKNDENGWTILNG